MYIVLYDISVCIVQCITLRTYIRVSEIGIEIASRAPIKLLKLKFHLESDTVEQM